ncbi:hypothetical protein B6D60_11075 [candidate division KSB1 bacterium 4484_87]|nr:MAG: hypothetical protein B6D60_11075 [candidate division KSB1 bacterium 4484_87]
MNEKTGATKPLYNAKGWLRLIGVVSIIYGVFRHRLGDCLRYFILTIYNFADPVIFKSGKMNDN